MIGEIGQAESDASRLIERIRGAWEARRRTQLWAGSYSGALVGNPCWRRVEPTPPSGPFAQLAREV